MSILCRVGWHSWVLLTDEDEPSIRFASAEEYWFRMNHYRCTCCGKRK